MIEVRKNIRVPVSLTPRYRIPTVFEYVEAPCYDLSAGGMFIESDSPVERGTLLKFECDVRNQQVPILGVGRVVWRRDGNAKKGPSGMGVKFVKLDPGSDQVIANLVEKNAERAHGGRQEPVESGRQEPVESGRQEPVEPKGEGDDEQRIAESESYGKSSAAPASSRPGLVANLIIIGFITLAVLAATLVLLLE